MLNAAVLSSAKLFLLCNARLLERMRFAFLFEGGSAQRVLVSLRAYQNTDGGFGNALEPDKRCVDSQPIDQEMGLEILDEIGFDGEIARRVCDYLESITTPEGGVPFVLPSVASAPRSPWWNTEPNPPPNLNPTASIAGYLHKAHFQHAWLDRATEFCWAGVERVKATEPHELLCVLDFLRHVPDRLRAEQETQRLGQLMLHSGVVATDPHAGGYVFGPLDFAPSPVDPLHELFSAQLIAEHLDALGERQQADGGWPITWQAVSPACEMEYRGIRTLAALKVLQAYGRL
ncbi:MAG TPA: hypothetical protein VGK81_07565 [Anaerolineae bacterium]